MSSPDPSQSGPAPADPFLGRQLGKFRLERKLGQGGMGAVYLALDTRLERRVALKLLPPELAAQPEWVARFQREARKAARLEHKNVVQVYEVDELEGVQFISMQLLSGGSLQDQLRERGKLPPAEAARIAREAACGLMRAHREGVIHRDVKPANILLGQEGEVRLGDFGLVKDVGGGAGDAPLTQTGAILGTPHYMAPEQCEGLPDIDHRADLYALGLVLYQSLSGVLPALGSTPLQIISNRLRHDPRPLSEVAPDVPPALAAVVSALLVRDREQRLGSAEAVVERLDAFLTGGAQEPTLSLAPTLPPSGKAAVAGAETVSLSPPAPPGPVTPGGTGSSWQQFQQPGPPQPAAPPGAQGPPGRSAPPTGPRGPTPPRGPAAPGPKPRRGWSCWRWGCCLALLLGGGVLGLIVLAKVAQEVQQQAALGGSARDVFWAGQQVEVELGGLFGPLRLPFGSGSTSVGEAHSTGGGFELQLRPLPLVEDQQLRLVVRLEGDTPRVFGFIDAKRVLWSNGLEEGQVQQVPEGILITCPCLTILGEEGLGEEGLGEEGMVELRFFGR